MANITLFSPIISKLDRSKFNKFSKIMKRINIVKDTTVGNRANAFKNLKL
jgi:hypothetical protein